MSEEQHITTSNTMNIEKKTLFRTVTFSLNEQLYAINILNIRDIVLGKQIYSVPNSDPCLIGVTNIRGEILPVYSLKNILGLEEKLIGEKKSVLIDLQEEYLIIVRYKNFLLAVIVDYVDKNLNVDESSYTEGKYMSKWSEEPIFSGIIIDHTDNILLIDIESLINILIHKSGE